MEAKEKKGEAGRPVQAECPKQVIKSRAQVTPGSTAVKWSLGWAVGAEPDHRWRRGHHLGTNLAARNRKPSHSDFRLAAQRLEAASAGSRTSCHQDLCLGSS